MNNQPAQKPKRGQPLKNSEGKRQQMPLNLSPSNFAFLESLGRGKHDYANMVFDQIRKKILEQ